ncbi:MAG: arsenate reductase (azurin) large subunit [Candidatus Thiodiazotropha taylori]|nr:arsenate reductase (azurin) large subunit [Candidatus Thiodiazotropha taylori]MCW4225163.1 arsenate reductase (azurin) large subunit [Candidatus Thiodiazotropha endolucinida]MCG7884255.1 arsenate reductase (azurin) large subunit [Candidatus Thiodiazotropha taylori]MCG7886734.1 arsenate reductase (azurin) large subunit [Candidatus Thiodiazotropha taylori]MCG7891469.1 arsenate reductase (azurin) large subunit [Candidatus Thiodiazotropha taylori]
MATKYYLPEDKTPLPPKSAEVLTTCCDYCIVACGYKVYRWPVGVPNGGMKASENAFGVDFPSGPLQAWVASTQHNVVMHKGRPHNVVVIPDKDAKVVNISGDSSIRGGTIAQKCYNPDKPTNDRLMSPMIRINGTLQPVSWDMALDVATDLMKYTVKQYGANAYGMKIYSYQFVENTYAGSKFARRSMKTANWTMHDTPANVTSTPGFRDAGFDNFGPAYKDWGDAEVLMICGTDPYETKTMIFNQFMKPAIDGGQKTIWVNVRETAGIAYAKSRGNALFIQLDPGTDTPVLGAIARVIMENGWEDSEWIKKWVNNKWESSSGFGQGTRNTPWQWRTTWGKFQTKGFEDYKKWNFAQDEFDPKNAAKIANIPVEQIYQAAEWMAKPKADGTRPKTSLGIEKGFYWSNNTGNTNAVSSLATICGAGGRPGQVVGRFGGHQRGGTSGGGYPRNKSAQKRPGRRRQALDCDRYFYSGNTRFAHVVGTTWIQSMCGSAGLNTKFEELVSNNPHQVRSFDKEEIVETLKKRMDSGGTVVLNQEIYLRDPIGSRFADIVLPAATWGEEDFVRANGERRIRLYSKFYDAPGDAKPDWWIFAQLGKKMGFDGFDWKNSNEVCEESSRFSRGNRKAYHMIKVAAHKEGKTLHEKLRELGTEGIQGPTFFNYKTGELLGTVRLHDTTMTEEQMVAEGRTQGANMVNKKSTHFNSQTGKVNIQKHPWSLFSDYWAWMKPKDDELWHTNGRINEIWQSGFDDVDRRAYISQRWPENWTEIHPDDAAKRGIESGDQVLLYSDRVPNFKQTIKGVHGKDFNFAELLQNGWIKLDKAAVTAVAIVTPHVKKGTMYSYFINTAQPSNALQGRVPDQISGNYNYKMGVARVKKIGESKYKGEFRSMSFAPRNVV